MCGATILSAEGKHNQGLDLSGADVRVRTVLRKLGVDSVEKLLAVNVVHLGALRNIGDVTIRRILLLQKKYGKELSIAGAEEFAAESEEIYGMEYFAKLLGVIMAAQKVTDSVKEAGRYNVTVSKRRMNSLKKAQRQLAGLAEEK